MSVSTSSYFSNSKVGVPQVASDVDIFAQDASPRFAIGHKIERQDGAIFRYVHFGAAITSAGLVLAKDENDSGFVTAQAVALTSSTYYMPEEPIGIYPNNKGSKYVIVRGTATADQFAGGYISFCSGIAAGGVTYRIKGNVATNTPVTSYFRVQLYDKLLAHVGSNASVQISGCKWADLTTAMPGASAGTDAICAGISIQSSGTTYPFGWIRTKGICAVLATDNAPLAGRIATLSTSIAGAVCAATVSTAVAAVLAPVIGTFCENNSVSSWAMVDVKLD